MLSSSNCISCISPALAHVTVFCFLSKLTQLELSLSLHPRKIPNSIIQKSLEELTSWVLLGWSLWTLPLALCSSHQDAAANPAELNNPTLILLGTTPPWGAVSDCFSCYSQDSSGQAMTSYRTPLKDNPLSNRNARLRTHRPKPDSGRGTSRLLQRGRGVGQDSGWIPWQEELMLLSTASKLSVLWKWNWVF